MGYNIAPLRLNVRSEDADRRLNVNANNEPENVAPRMTPTYVIGFMVILWRLIGLYFAIFLLMAISIMHFKKRRKEKGKKTTS